MYVYDTLNDTFSWWAFTARAEGPRPNCAAIALRGCLPASCLSLVTSAAVQRRWMDLPISPTSSTKDCASRPPRQVYRSNRSIPILSDHDRRHAGDQPPASSRPIPSRQSRNASKTTLGVQDNIMPKNTACKVVMSFRSTLLFRITVLDHRRFCPQARASHNAALILLHIAAHKSLCLKGRASKNPPGVNRRALRRLFTAQTN